MPRSVNDTRRTQLLARAIGGRRRIPSVGTLVRRASFPVRPPPIPHSVEPPSSTPTTGQHYDTEWARHPVSRAARAALVETVVRPVIAGLARPTRTGLDRLESLDRLDSGPVIFAANHHSHVDTPLLITSIPHPWRSDLVVGAAADYFFGTRLTAAASALVIGAIPIERAKIGRRSADLAADLVDDGWSLLIYPEGGRSKDGWGQPFRGGAAYLALRCGVPVVPVHVTGSRQILRKGKLLPRPSATTVNFGSPLFPAEGESSRSLAARIEQGVAALGDETATDWWQARRRAHAGETPSLTGPRASSWRRSWAHGSRGSRRRRQQRRWPDLG